MSTTRYRRDNNFYNIEYYKDPTIFTIEGMKVSPSDNQDAEGIDVFLPGTKKFLFHLNISFYHFLIDLFVNILTIYKMDKNFTYIFYIHKLEPDAVAKNIHLQFLFHFLEKKRISYHVIESKTKNKLLLDNCYIVTTMRDLAHANIEYINIMNNDLLEFIKNKEIIPFRKVFLARSKSFNDAHRYSEEYKIINYFKKYNFEIVYPEDFKSFEDQINFFYETKILCGVTGAGLANSVFMQNGATVIEITVTLNILQDDSITSFETAHHHFYSMIAFLKEHLYISIPSFNQKFSDIEKILNKKIIRSLK